jgi:hypothetical protein
VPIEAVQLRNAAEPYERCPKCNATPFRSTMFRGLVQNGWRKLLRRPYCCVICDKCKEIVGYEKPPVRHG